jgi:hypothetical protein
MDIWNVKEDEKATKLRYLGFNAAEVQLLFEYFCMEFKAAPLEFRKFMSRKESGSWCLKFRNYTLNEPTLKAIACVIPFLV